MAAIRFAQEGGNVCVADIDLTAAQLTTLEITQLGGTAFAIGVDVSLPKGNLDMVIQSAERYGSVDVAVLNAGYLGPLTGLDGADENLFEQQIAVNLKSCFLALKALEGYLATESSIVVTGSTAAIRGLEAAPLYAMAKHGLAGLVKSVAPTLSARGCRINMVAPGLVNTPMMGTNDRPSPADPKDLLRVAYQDGASPQHIAETILYLASPAAAYLNGSTVVADGGLIVGHPVVERQ